MTGHPYDKPADHGSTYERCARLVRVHAEARRGAVHLDLACGTAALAGPIQALGLTYVGVDADSGAVDATRARGVEAHLVDLGAPDVAQTLDRIVGDRPVASVSSLDGLEHLVDGQRLLYTMSSLLERHEAVGVLSVPHVGHRDVAAKLLAGRWDYTRTGLLDDTHLRFYTRGSLTEALATSGLVPVDSDDVLLEQSDQHFPDDHPFLATGPLADHLRRLCAIAGADGLTNQFVWAVRPGAATVTEGASESTGPESFLTVLLAVDGRRELLRETLLALSAQSDPDLDVVLLVPPDARDSVDEVLADQPPRLTARVRVEHVESGGPTAWNHGLTLAAGRFVSLVREGDLPLGRWASAFRTAAERGPLRVLRGQCVGQAVEIVEVAGRRAVRASGPPDAVYAERFSLLQHLRDRHTPSVGWAVPTSVVRYLSLGFDEGLEATADWELLVRAAELVGVCEVEGVLAIHRFVDAPAVEEDDRTRVLLAQRPVLMPAGEAILVGNGFPEVLGLTNLRDQLGRLREELRLTHQHAGNLEANIERLQASLQRQRQKVERLRRKLGKARATADGPVEATAQAGGRWRRRARPR